MQIRAECLGLGLQDEAAEITSTAFCCNIISGVILFSDIDFVIIAMSRIRTA